MVNNLLYLFDTYNYEYLTIITKVGDDEFGNYLTFKETIFHPQGGGQPSDIGNIINKDRDSVFIHYVGYSNGIIKHYYDPTAAIFEVDNEVQLLVDKSSRITNAKCHTAGHLIHEIVESITDLKVVKGYHFKTGAYVEFSGDILNIDKSNLLEQLNDKIRQSIAADYSINTRMELPSDILSGICNGEGNDTSDKLVRIVQISNYSSGIPCGGTHLKSLSEVGTVHVLKIKQKSGNIRFSYLVE